MMALLFLVPIIQLLILGYTVSSEVRNINLAVCDMDESPLSRELTERFRNSRYFRLRCADPRENRIRQYLDNGQVSAAVVFPIGLSENVARGVPSRIQVLMDGQDSNTSTIALGYILGILENYMQDELALMSRNPEAPDLHLLTPQVRVWYNEDLRPSHFMVPGIAVFLLTLVTTLVSAMGLVREKEIGTLEQLLVSPLKKHEILIGKIIPFSAVGFIELALAVAFAKIWYGIPIAGKLSLFALFSLIYLFTTLGLGLLISATAKSQQQAMFMTVFLMFFFIIMSGFLFPIENMPVAMRILSHLNPMRYMITATREIFIKGATLHSLYLEGIALVVFGGVIFSFAVRRFQNRMA